MERQKQHQRDLIYDTLEKYQKCKALRKLNNSNRIRQRKGSFLCPESEKIVKENTKVLSILEQKKQFEALAEIQSLAQTCQPSFTHSNDKREEQDFEIQASPCEMKLDFKSFVQMSGNATQDKIFSFQNSCQKFDYGKVMSEEIQKSQTDVIECIRPSIPREQEYDCDFGDEIDEDSFTDGVTAQEKQF